MHTQNAKLAALTATAVCLASIPGAGRGCTDATAIEGKVPVDIRAIEAACENYAQDHGGAYPVDLVRLLERDATGRSYLRIASVPLDPWRRPYLYAPTDAHCLHPRIWTFGRDGVAGGEGDDRDVDDRMLRVRVENP